MTMLFVTLYVLAAITLYLLTLTRDEFSCLMIWAADGLSRLQAFCRNRLRGL